MMNKIYGGRTEIRTQERVAPLPVFKTGAFNHSAISPVWWRIQGSNLLPPECKSGALPDELIPQTNQTLLRPLTVLV